jgi:hypothetical protein
MDRVSLLRDLPRGVAAAADACLTSATGQGSSSARTRVPIKSTPTSSLRPCGVPNSTLLNESASLNGDLLGRAGEGEQIEQLVRDERSRVGRFPLGEEGLHAGQPPIPYLGCMDEENF